MQENSPCVRCGKIRVVSKSWEEKVGTSLVKYTLTICPDPECQKIVDEQLKKKRDHIQAIQKESLKRRENMRNSKKSHKKTEKKSKR